MPLRDHFHPPTSHRIQWNSFYSAWLNRIADDLCERLPDDYNVEVSVKPAIQVGVDVEVTRPEEVPSPFYSTWQPPPRQAVAPIVFPDRYEIRVDRQFGGRQFVAAIELISPGNKDAPDTREAFAAKVASYLHEGVSVLIVDVVTERRANLHDEIVRLMRMPTELLMPPQPELYAASYRPVVRAGRPEFDIWLSPFAVGDALPTMPLRLIADYFVPVELEATYTETGGDLLSLHGGVGQPLG